MGEKVHIYYRDAVKSPVFWICRILISVSADAVFSASFILEGQPRLAILLTGYDRRSDGDIVDMVRGTCGRAHQGWIAWPPVVLRENLVGQPKLGVDWIGNTGSLGYQICQGTIKITDWQAERWILSQTRCSELRFGYCFLVAGWQ